MFYRIVTWITSTETTMRVSSRVATSKATSSGVGAGIVAGVGARVWPTSVTPASSKVEEPTADLWVVISPVSAGVPL